VGEPVPATEVHAGFVGVVKSNVGQRYEGDPLVPKSIIESYLEASQLEVEHQRTRLTRLLAVAKAGGGDVAQAPVQPGEPVPTEVQAPEQLQAELDALRLITAEEAKKLALTNLSNPLVPRGHIGVWQEVLLPGKYYLNPLAFTITHMDTRVQTWRYEGGYTRRFFNLEIGPDGAITQAIVEEPIGKPEGAADEAIIHKVEGWDVWLESRVLVQVTPDNAPFVVAYVGELREVEDRIITPMYRSVSRNILGTRDVKVLDVLYERQAMEEAVENAIKPEGLKTGLIIREVRFGDPYVPPELLIPGKRMQLARQMLETFDQEKKAQESRVEVERKKAEADQQSVLIAAQIKRQADEQLGIGSKNRLENEAEGQRAQVAVLGADKTLELAMLREQLSILRELLPVLAEHPELVKVPTVLVQGDKAGLAGAAAILGNSTLGQALGNLGR
jgi:regulator of protease activity HflC (stomatin/prohibitin superfamily)